MPVTDEIARLVRASRDRTVAATDQQVVALTTAWVDLWSELEPEFASTLALIIADGGETIPASVIARDRRMGQALTQARAALDQLVQDAAGVITQDVGAVVLDAADAHLASLQAQLPPTAPGVTLGTLDPDTLDAIVARSTQQITALTLPLSDFMERQMKAELVKAITVGDGPNAAARKIMQRTEGKFFGGLPRATRIARTELIDAHRQADLASAKANRSLITGWYWHCTFDARTCSGCLGMHGTLHDVDTFGPYGHQQCRCARIDKTKTWAELGFVGIEDDDRDLAGERDAWFDGLTDDTQRSIMGPERLELFKSGQVGWADMATLRHTDGWRDSVVQTPVKDLLPG